MRVFVRGLRYAAHDLRAGWMAYKDPMMEDNKEEPGASLSTRSSQSWDGTKGVRREATWVLTKNSTSDRMRSCHTNSIELEKNEAVTFLLYSRWRIENCIHCPVIIKCSHQQISQVVKGREHSLGSQTDVDSSPNAPGSSLCSMCDYGQINSV